MSAFVLGKTVAKSIGKYLYSTWKSNVSICVTVTAIRVAGADGVMFFVACALVGVLAAVVAIESQEND